MTNTFWPIRKLRSIKPIIIYINLHFLWKTRLCNSLNKHPCSLLVLMAHWNSVYWSSRRGWSHTYRCVIVHGCVSGAPLARVHLCNPTVATLPYVIHSSVCCAAILCYWGQRKQIITHCVHAGSCVSMNVVFLLCSHASMDTKQINL